MENRNLNPREIQEKIREWCFRYYNFSIEWDSPGVRAHALMFDVLGNPTIFEKLDSKIRCSKKLTCPHCGKEGWLTEKTTVSKRKYKYRKLYVRHNIYERLCYLNKNDLKSPAMVQLFERLNRAINVREWFYKSVILTE